MSERSDALQLFNAFLADERVSTRVKDLLRREYVPSTPLFDVFIAHSSSVAEASVAVARECGAEEMFVWEAAWLHDIGIKYTHAPGIHCHGSEHYLRHGIIGRELCEKAGLPRHGLVCERHVGTGISAREVEEQGLPLPPRDMLCVTKEERLICYVDQFFSKSVREPLTPDQVVPRIKRHGEGPWGRYLELRNEFGKYFPKPAE